MDLFQSMNVFVAVAEENSITGAAARLSLSKALVSKTVSQLEEHLNLRLLNRTTRRLSLTEAGADYLAHCRAMIEENALAEARLMLRAEEPSGWLRITAPTTFGLAYVAPIVGAFMDANPRVSVDLSLNDRLVDLVDEGIDVAIRISATAPDSAIVTRLCTTRHILVAAPRLIDRLGPPPSREVLDAWPILEYTLR